MANLFDMSNLRNHVHRNGFDLSTRNLFTAKVGELLPVLTKEIIPGDTIDIDLSSFTRTQPVNTAAFTRIQEYYDFYFVPNRLLWDKWPAYIAQTNQPFHAYNRFTSASVSTHPYISGYALYNLMAHLAMAEHGNPATSIPTSQVYNELGFSRYETCCRLLTMLGYGPIKRNLESTFKQLNSGVYHDYTWKDIPTNWIGNPYTNLDQGNPVKDQALNPFPLLAYNKIYQDYFRFDQWERRTPYTCNLDYMMSNVTNDYELSLYSMLVDFTNDAFAPTTATQFLCDLRYCNYKKDLLMGILPTPQFGDTAVASPIIGLSPATVSFIDPPVAGANDASLEFVKSPTNPTTANTAGISIFSLRQAEFLQKWKEITNSGKLDYADQISKHWDVSMPHALSDCCDWLGGTTGVININEVVNTALGDSDALLKGKATGAANGHIHETFKEHGILMCIYHAVPLMDYENIGLDRLCTKVTTGAYAIPEFDSLGMEALHVTDILAENVPVVTKYKDPEYDDEGNVTIVGGEYVEQVLPLLGAQSEMPPLGYVPRYVEYKTSRDLVNGGFLDSLRNWVAPIDARSLFDRLVDSDGAVGTNYNTFKVNPSCVNSIFGVQVTKESLSDEDPLLISANFDIKAVRNLSRDGLPY